MSELSEDNKKCVVKVVGIFWDTDSCPIPHLIAIEEVVDSVMKCANIGSVDHKLDVFCCSCRLMSDLMINSLNALKVDVLLVSSDKNSADNKLIDKMNHFLDNENNSNKPKILVLVSGDSHFVQFLNNKAKISAQIEVVVIYWDDCSQQLLNDFNCVKLEFNSVEKDPKLNTRINEFQYRFNREVNDYLSGKPPVLPTEDERKCSDGCDRFADFCCLLFSCFIA